MWHKEVKIPITKLLTRLKILGLVPYLALMRETSPNYFMHKTILVGSYKEEVKIPMTKLSVFLFVCHRQGSRWTVGNKLTQFCPISIVGSKFYESGQNPYCIVLWVWPVKIHNAFRLLHSKTFCPSHISRNAVHKESDCEWSSIMISWPHVWPETIYPLH